MSEKQATGGGRRQIRCKPRLELPVLRRVFCLEPPEPDYGGKDKIEVLGGLLEGELPHLRNHVPHLVDCAMSRLVRLISVRLKEGGLAMPPPIVSRIYQELSNGALGFHQAQKIARVPFPFPYAQLLALMKVYFILTVPMAVPAGLDHEDPRQGDSTRTTRRGPC